jgi:flagellar motor protein MotB
MSWSTSTVKPVLKVDAENELITLYVQAINPGGVQVQNVPQEEVDRQVGCVSDQIKAALAAVRELLKAIPGPYVQISISGHANGAGWHKKEGYANDCISVTVTQMIAGDFKP